MTKESFSSLFSLKSWWRRWWWSSCWRRTVNKIRRWRRRSQGNRSKWKRSNKVIATLIQSHDLHDTSDDVLDVRSTGKRQWVKMTKNHDEDHDEDFVEKKRRPNSKNIKKKIVSLDWGCFLFCCSYCCFIHTKGGMNVCDCLDFTHLWPKKAHVSKTWRFPGSEVMIDTEVNLSHHHLLFVSSLSKSSHSQDD